MIIDLEITKQLAPKLNPMGLQTIKVETETWVNGIKQLHKRKWNADKELNSPIVLPIWCF